MMYLMYVVKTSLSLSLLAINAEAISDHFAVFFINAQDWQNLTVAVAIQNEMSFLKCITLFNALAVPVEWHHMQEVKLIVRTPV